MFIIDRNLSQEYELFLKKFEADNLVMSLCFSKIEYNDDIRNNDQSFCINQRKKSDNSLQEILENSQVPREDIVDFNHTNDIQRAPTFLSNKEFYDSRFLVASPYN